MWCQKLRFLLHPLQIFPVEFSSLKTISRLHQEVWKDQLYRAFVGDRLFYWYDVATTGVENQTIHDLIERNSNITDLPQSVFMTPDITVSTVAKC